MSFAWHMRARISKPNSRRKLTFGLKVACMIFNQTCSFKSKSNKEGNSWGKIKCSVKKRMAISLFNIIHFVFWKLAMYQTFKEKSSRITVISWRKFWPHIASQPHTVIFNRLVIHVFVRTAFNNVCNKTKQEYCTAKRSWPPSCSTSELYRIESCLSRNVSWYGHRGDVLLLIIDELRRTMCATPSRNNQRVLQHRWKLAFQMHCLVFWWPCIWPCVTSVLGLFENLE